MLRRSETRYARAPDGAYLAYQMIGSGDVDVVYHPGAATHAELIWDFPSIMRWPLRLASMARVVTFDLRGCGASDPLPTARGFTLDESVADVVAVMDAAGIDKAALIGEAFVGPVFLRIAAQRRERVTALALSGTAARFVRTPDYPFGIPPDALERALEALEAGWGTGTTIDLWVPSLAGSSTQRREWARYERGCCTPGRAALLARTWWAFDARRDLPDIRVPTMVEHSVDDRMVPIGLGRYLAAHVPGAQFVERTGDRLTVGTAVDQVAGDYARFLLGDAAHAVGTEHRVATVVFLDIVESTATAMQYGDRGWRDLLDDFRRVVRAELEPFAGREVNTRGDDFLLVFDLPRGAVGCATVIRERAEVLGLALRAGIHVGEIDDLGDDVTGMSVHIGARLAELARAGEILLSQTVRDVVIGSDLVLEDRGTHELRGVPNEWRVFSVVS